MMMTRLAETAVDSRPRAGLAPAMLALGMLAAPWTGAAVPPAAPSEAAAAVQAPTVEGTWSTRARERSDNRRRIQLNLEVDRTGRDGTWRTGFELAAEEIDGLTFEQAAGTVEEARFRIVRDAGTISLEGSIRDGRGAGTFAFVPATDWIAEMGDLGYDDLSDDEVFSAALHDVSTAYVRELQQLGYTDLPEGELFAFAIHGVTPDFIREMNGLGYRDIPADELVALRIHGVTPDWVREVRRAMGGQ